MESGHSLHQTTDQQRTQPSEPALENREETTSEAEDSRTRSEGNHSGAISDFVHTFNRNSPRRRGCASLETISVIGCFLLVGILALMHIHFVGDPPGEGGCLPVGIPQLIPTPYPVIFMQTNLWWLVGKNYQRSKTGTDRNKNYWIIFEARRSLAGRASAGNSQKNRCRGSARRLEKICREGR